ncbi:hypothetical protein D3C86_1202880 [compost metagenome]
MIKIDMTKLLTTDLHLLTTASIPFILLLLTHTIPVIILVQVTGSTTPICSVQIRNLEELHCGRSEDNGILVMSISLIQM